MNRERAKELLPIIQAWANGESIEARRDTVSDWVTMHTETAFPDDFEYRIKPKPREFWLCWDNFDPNNLQKFEGKEYTELTVEHWDNYIKVREVL